MWHHLRTTQIRMKYRIRHHHTNYQTLKGSSSTYAVNKPPHASVSEKDLKTYQIQNLMGQEIQHASYNF